jgi:hypothetical protein
MTEFFGCFFCFFLAGADRCRSCTSAYFSVQVDVNVSILSVYVFFLKACIRSNGWLAGRDC